MIAIGTRTLTDRAHVDELVREAMRAATPSLPVVLMAVEGKVCLTFLQRDEIRLPRHVLKVRKPHVVVVSDGPLDGGTASPGPSSWRGMDDLRRLRPAACLIYTRTASAEQSMAAVVLAMRAGPVLMIECSPDRAADWEWLVRPWCPTVATLDGDGSSSGIPDRIVTHGR